MKTVESLVKELAAVQDALIALPDDAFVERFNLVRRRDELRQLADEHAEGADMERPIEDLLAELVTLRTHLVDNPSLRDEGRIAKIMKVLDRRGAAPS